MTKIHYRKRVPKPLQPILNRKEFKHQFNHQSEVDMLNTLIENAMTIVHSKLDLDSKYDLIKNTMKKYVVENKHKIRSTTSLEEAIDLYLQWSKQNVCNAEFKTRSSFFTNLLPKLLNHLHIPTNDISEITSIHLFKLSKKITQLPNRQQHIYHTMDLDKYVKLIVNEEAYITTETANKLIKRIRSLSNYGHMTGLFNFPNTIPTIKQDLHKVKTNLHRSELTKQEITTLFSKLPHKAKLLSMIVYYSGLRPSEIHKCSISTIDNTLCFDLRNPTLPLKTSSSYRIVPIHPKLLPYVDEISQLTYSSIRATSSRINKHIKEHLQDTNKKTLYSLRHSFATDLIANQIQPEIVSELMGHVHSTMTMSRYVKGYPVGALKEAVESL